MKKLSLIALAILSMNLLSIAQVPYNQNTIYNKGDEAIISINGIDLRVEYLNDQPSNNYTPSAPTDNNSWLWSVSRYYTGEWTAYHYAFFADNPTTVTYASNTYVLSQELWASTPNPAEVASYNGGWTCSDCSEPSEMECENNFPDDYFSFNIAQENNGGDNTTPPNSNGGGALVSSLGSKFVSLNQERKCNTPFSI